MPSGTVAVLNPLFQGRRNGECERDALACVGTNRNATTVRFDDRSTDREPHADAVNFRRKEGIEQLVDIIRINTATAILHRHLDSSVLAAHR